MKRIYIKGVDDDGNALSLEVIFIQDNLYDLAEAIIKVSCSELYGFSASKKCYVLASDLPDFASSFARSDECRLCSEFNDFILEKSGDGKISFQLKYRPSLLPQINYECEIKCQYISITNYSIL